MNFLILKKIEKHITLILSYFTIIKTYFSIKRKSNKTRILTIFKNRAQKRTKISILSIGSENFFFLSKAFFVLQFGIKLHFGLLTQKNRIIFPWKWKAKKKLKLIIVNNAQNTLQKKAKISKMSNWYQKKNTLKQSGPTYKKSDLMFSISH